jgi:hypothetical protein
MPPFRTQIQTAEGRGSKAGARERESQHEVRRALEVSVERLECLRAPRLQCRFRYDEDVRVAQAGNSDQPRLSRHRETQLHQADVAVSRDSRVAGPQLSDMHANHERESSGPGIAERHHELRPGYYIRWIPLEKGSRLPDHRRPARRWPPAGQCFRPDRRLSAHTGRRFYSLTTQSDGRLERRRRSGRREGTGRPRAPRLRLARPSAALLGRPCRFAPIRDRRRSRSPPAARVRTGASARSTSHRRFNPHRHRARSECGRSVNLSSSWQA